MVRTRRAARGIRDERVLEAFRAVPREAFVPEALAEFAYADSALPIEEGQTISQPCIVALMVAGAERYDRAMYYGANESWTLRDQHRLRP
ncbi:MAG: hypothetical protein R3F35_04870 [Myxococcota bacterium]